MKKVLLSSLFIVAIAGYIIYQHVTGQTNVNPVAGNTSPTMQNTTTSAPTASSTPTGLYKNGSYTGAVADAYYGDLQVQAIITNGEISDVVFLKYPNTSGHTIELSNQVMPQLKSEAIQAQSAKVNIISGATQDSEAFQKSLASALALAQN